MMPATKSEIRINVHLNGELRRTVEDAAAEMGQSIGDFAVSTLVASAREILREQRTTRLSDRDRKRFVAMLDDVSTKPSDALIKAAKRYKKLVG
jgi:uncharacterized protein (DUF1778 family)